MRGAPALLSSGGSGVPSEEAVAKEEEGKMKRWDGDETYA